LATAAPATIVVAEDDYGLRSLITAVLTRQGHRVLEASDGVQLVRLLASQEIDGVMLDVRLGPGRRDLAGA
jgi:DNA-binding response OmpR family regulator